LKATIRITLREALLGFVKPLKHLGGHSLDLDRAGQITKPGHVDTIPGEGMPKAEYNSERGDLHITYDVVFPKELTA
jgi:DnaJ-class molecular chaperone